MHCDLLDCFLRFIIYRFFAKLEFLDNLPKQNYNYFFKGLIWDFVARAVGLRYDYPKLIWPWRYWGPLGLFHSGCWYHHWIYSLISGFKCQIYRIGSALPGQSFLWSSQWSINLQELIKTLSNYVHSTPLLLWFPKPASHLITCLFLDA